MARASKQKPPNAQQALWEGADAPARPSFARERILRQAGYTLIAGVDEAGRAPLAGPVTAAAVILPQGLDEHAWGEVNDSKQVSEKERERLYERITREAQAYAAAHVSAREIESIGIHKASLLAMRRALEKLPIVPDYALVDGKFLPDWLTPAEAIVGGDGASLSIGAASIIAKVVRDRLMTALHERYPDYGFDRHKGYPTPYHRVAIRLLGPCPEHRRTFGGVKEFCESPPPPSLELKSWMEQARALSTAEELEALLAKRRPLLSEDEERWFLERFTHYRLDALKAAESKGAPSNVERGQAWEEIAARWLEKQGYAIWERNYRIPGGEIDLVARQGESVVFVEVKARASSQFGAPLEAITAKKRRAMIRAAERYLYERGLLDEWDIRYDVIGILAPKGESPQIEHIEDAFRVEEELG